MSELYKANQNLHEKIKEGGRKGLEISEIESDWEIIEATGNFFFAKEFFGSNNKKAFLLKNGGVWVGTPESRCKLFDYQNLSKLLKEVFAGVQNLSEYKLYAKKIGEFDRLNLYEVWDDLKDCFLALYTAETGDSAMCQYEEIIENKTLLTIHHRELFDTDGLWEQDEVKALVRVCEMIDERIKEKLKEIVENTPLKPEF